MQPSEALSLRELPPRHAHRDVMRALVLDGAPTRTVVHGDRIAAQFRCDRVHLLVTQYDHYESVSHWFHVIGPGGAVLDLAATPDTFGFLDQTTIEPSQSLLCGFFGSAQRWRVRVLDPAVWSFTALDLRLRANRFLLSKRHLRFEPIAPPSG